MNAKIGLNKIIYITLSYKTYKNKIDGQLEAWKRRGFDCLLLSIESNSEGLFSLIEYKFGSEKITSVVRFSNLRKKQLYRQLAIHFSENYDSINNILYIRRLGINLIYFGRYIKQFKSKILYEIPTYPIDSGTSFFRKVALKIENIYFDKRVYPYLAGIPVFIQSFREPFKEKFIPLENAVKVLKDKVYFENQGNNQLTFIFLGNLQKWHGLEKFIEEIKVFSKKEVKLEIFSSNTETYAKFKKMYCNIENIIFNDAITFAELEDKLTGDLIGVGGLDYESRGAEVDTSLKNKDYAALGIPFIYKLPDISFQNYPYALKLENRDFNGTLVTKVIRWYNSIYTPTMNQKIKNYALSNLTYDNQVEKVIRKLLN
ncbi:hypothetical protein [Streptococcus porcinus]